MDRHLHIQHSNRTYTLKYNSHSSKKKITLNTIYIFLYLACQLGRYGINCVTSCGTSVKTEVFLCLDNF